MFKSFYPLLEEFLCIYLPMERGYSPNTILSYYTSICQFTSWFSVNSSIDKQKITIFDFTKEHILRWLDNIEENGCSISTRNQRLAGINSFLSYVAEIESVYMDTHLSVKQIKVKKGSRPKKDFLSIEELHSLVGSIKLTNSMGIRHYVLLSILYDSAARIHEIIHMKAEEISYGRNCSIKIFGKGSKTRIAYLSSDSAFLLKDYCKRFGITEGILFKNRCGQPLTDSGIDYIIKKYVAEASVKTPSLKAKTVSAHTFRRSKATHMLLNGISLPVIQRFLGHGSIKTTEEYLEIGSEAMVKAVNSMGNALLDKNSMDSVASWENEDIMEQIRAKITLP